MQNNLFLQRLRIVTLQGKVAYDECFHEGVNIIRGQNSSGKSTIVRFIFFALGGCYSEFVPEAMKCHEVMAQVIINGEIVLTLKRILERTSEGKVNPRTPMYIFIGTMDESMQHEHRDNWKRFGYMTTSNTRSFSNVLFKLMGLHEFKADSNITMHQILRLVYLDQESPLASLFFFEQFDTENTRQTVADLLMGLYDERLSQAMLDRLEVLRNIDNVKAEIKAVGSFFARPETRSTAFLNEQIADSLKEIETLTSQV